MSGGVGFGSGGRGDRGVVYWCVEHKDICGEALEDDDCTDQQDEPVLFYALKLRGNLNIRTIESV